MYMHNVIMIHLPPTQSGKLAWRRFHGWRRSSGFDPADPGWTDFALPLLVARGARSAVSTSLVRNLRAGGGVGATMPTKRSQAGLALLANGASYLRQSACTDVASDLEHKSKDQIRFTSTSPIGKLTLSSLSRVKGASWLGCMMEFGFVPGQSVGPFSSFFQSRYSLFPWPLR